MIDRLFVLRNLMEDSQKTLVRRTKSIHEYAQNGTLLMGHIATLIHCHERAEAATEIIQLLENHLDEKALSEALHLGLWRSASEGKSHKADLYGSAYGILNGTESIHTD